MRNIIIASIVVLLVSLSSNIIDFPPQPTVQASKETKPSEALKQPTKPKTVKHAPKKQKLVKQAQKQPVVVHQSVPKPVAVPTGSCSDWIRAAGISDVANAAELIQRESGCSVSADNPTSDAYGIPQALPGSKMASHGSDWATNPVTQLRWMQDYVNARYGGFAQANAFQLANGWY